jgi:hypothetical protein
MNHKHELVLKGFDGAFYHECTVCGEQMDSAGYTKPVTEYTLKTTQRTKMFGDKEVTYSVNAYNKEEAVDKLFNNLKNYKWTRDEVRSAIV